MNGRVAGRRGNAADHTAPHSAYPCAGQDRWCAIACETDEEWRDLVAVMGSPDWGHDPRYASLANRKRHEAELDRQVAAWTSTQDAHALTQRLQEAGVPAGVVQSCADLHRDPQIAARPGLVWLEHPEMGRTPYEAWAFRLASHASGLRRAPRLGEHTDEVLRDLLGLTGEEVARLRADGVLA